MWKLIFLILSSFQYIVFRGERTRNTDVYEPAEVITHEAYDSETREHDIGFIRLKDKINLIPGVRGKMLLPQIKETYDKLLFAGWGDIRKGGKNSMARRLREITLQICNNSQCMEHSNYIAENDEYPICYVSPLDTGPCERDEGGPLAHETPEGNFLLIGLHSKHPFSCGQRDAYSFHTYVFGHLDWLREQLPELHIPY